jgi:cytosine/adenosine deaminase-related metal-dependent hydrolase
MYSLESILRASAAVQCPVAVHLGEVRADVDALRTRFKKSPLRILKDSGVLVPSSHLIHCNHLPEKDLDIIRGGENTLTLCVSSTVAKQTGYPLLRALASRDVRICLGTDWGETDMLGEIGVLRNIRKYVPGTPAYSPLELIRMATINGAHALGIAAHTGSLEVGKHADLVMIPLDDIRLPAPGSAPGAGELARIITDYCTTDMISDVMAQGVFRIRDGEPVGADAGSILSDFRRLQEMYIPRGEREEERAQGTPLTTADPGEKPALLGHGETEADSPREQNANTALPGGVPDESLQKFPVVTKKITKVFGADDV